MGHWYTESGTPRHYQSDGKDTTLAHARKQALRPSVTGILGVAANPGLTEYFINQHLKSAWENDILYADYDVWCKEIRQKAKEHSTQARDKGSAIHNALDDHYSGRFDEVDRDLAKYVIAVNHALKGVYGVSVGDADPEKSFSTIYYGGSVDLSNPKLIVDYKFKSSGWELKKDGTPKKIWYQENVAQLAAYRQGLGYKDAVVANVFISPEAEVYIKEWTEEEVEDGLEYFNACLVLWNCKNKLFKQEIEK